MNEEDKKACFSLALEVGNVYASQVDLLSLRQLKNDYLIPILENLLFNIFEKSSSKKEQQIFNDFINFLENVIRLHKPEAAHFVLKFIDHLQKIIREKNSAQKESSSSLRVKKRALKKANVLAFVPDLKPISFAANFLLSSFTKPLKTLEHYKSASSVFPVLEQAFKLLQEKEADDPTDFPLLRHSNECFQATLKLCQHLRSRLTNDRRENYIYLNLILVSLQREDLDTAKFFNSSCEDLSEHYIAPYTILKLKKSIAREEQWHSIISLFITRIEEKIEPSSIDKVINQFALELNKLNLSQDQLIKIINFFEKELKYILIKAILNTKKDGSAIEFQQLIDKIPSDFTTSLYLSFDLTQSQILNSRGRDENS